jgi:hypothetical protein
MGVAGGEAAFDEVQDLTPPPLIRTPEIEAMASVTAGHSLNGDNLGGLKLVGHCQSDRCSLLVR